ncbi:carbohydrate ABC transporter permease [Paenibacillus crassostreae]|uniref:Glycerol-3-phosphate ABC transporter permease n=1 Tax=Paenibacillus crassostreae TaxID=1763538 RepID=A0A167DVF4_9BACL|nr:carbohydrate ABC transporter permease [Paenibacillus crassostreae]AOZ91017.1 glycerol-3-phosphate ABC transporter permease [Paenibacillus crassostreae]OAB74821.1 glycerol-3-phosphate ABC transporter permease [Paenibacillus crassostreae]
MIINKWNQSFLYLALAIASCLILFPLLYTLSSSFMTSGESAIYPPRFIPSELRWDNYLEVLQTIPVIRFISNSFVVSTFIMLGQIVTASTAAYAFAFLRFPGKTFLFALFLATMMIPWEVTMIPNYLTVKDWNLLDSYTGLILPFLASAFGTFLLRQAYLQLPSELFEAARIDGCGHFRIFLSLVIPLTTPAIATLGVYTFLNHWNNYLWPLLITNKEEMRTVQIGISMLQFEEMTSWNLVLAGVVTVLIPSLLLLILGLKPLVKGITAGALKG